jgi:hypothetical protein
MLGTLAIFVKLFAHFFVNDEAKYFSCQGSITNARKTPHAAQYGSSMLRIVSHDVSYLR